MSPSSPAVLSACLYDVTGDGKTVLFVTDDCGSVIAAARPIAAWALGRTLQEVTVTAARFGCQVALHTDSPVDGPAMARAAG